MVCIIYIDAFLKIRQIFIVIGRHYGLCSYRNQEYVTIIAFGVGYLLN